MKKLFFVSIFIVMNTLAYDVEIKKENVILLVNDKNVSYSKGDKFTLSAGNVICFSNGNGRAVITGKNYRKQLSKRSKSCKYLKGEDTKAVQYTTAIRNGVVSMFSKSKEKSVDGVSRKSVESDTLTAPIALSNETKYLAVENSTWGPLPITLEILDKKNKVVKTMINEEDEFTSFIVPRSLLFNGYTLKVTNTFDEVLVNSTIYIQK